MNRKSMVAYLSRFNVDLIKNLNTWSDVRLSDAVTFIKAEFKRA